MNQHSSDFQKAKLQRPGNRYKIPPKVDQRKIDEILGQELPGTPPFNRNNDSSQSNLSRNSYFPTNNKSNKKPVLPPLGSKKIEYSSVPSVPNPRQNISNRRRNSNESNNSKNETYELPRITPHNDTLCITNDLSDLENSDSCSSAPEEFEKTLPKKISKSNSIDNFNLASTTILDDFFQSDESDSEGSAIDAKDDNGSESSFDEIFSEDEGASIEPEEKRPKYFLSSRELSICKDVFSIHSEVKQRFDKLMKIARNHFPATKESVALITRLVEQSRACHEFHFLEKRTKYYESENRGLSIALSSLDDIISNPQSASVNKVKFGLQRLNSLQVRQSKRMSKDLAKSQRKIKRLRSEIAALHTEMRAAVKTRRGGDGSLLIAEMSNNGTANAGGGNVAYFGGGSGLEDDEVAALKIEHKFAISKEKAAVKVLQNEIDEIDRIVNTYVKRIVLMTQKESNYSRLFKKNQSPDKTQLKAQKSSPKNQTKMEDTKKESPGKIAQKQKNKSGQNENESKKMPRQTTIESPIKKQQQNNQKNKKEEVPIIEVLSI